MLFVADVTDDGPLSSVFKRQKTNEKGVEGSSPSKMVVYKRQKKEGSLVKKDQMIEDQKKDGADIMKLQYDIVNLDSYIMK